ncbi:MAG: sulfite exporter TauE/SafE family protein [Rhodospirillaceae bacterium]
MPFDVALQPALALVSGGVSGFILGLIGGGGSVLAVPLLIYFVGVSDPHIAIGTSALAVSVNAFANLVPHARAGHVRWRTAVIFAVFGALGALGGSTLGKSFDGHRLLALFGILKPPLPNAGPPAAFCRWLEPAWPSAACPASSASAAVSSWCPA